MKREIMRNIIRAIVICLLPCMGSLQSIGANTSNTTESESVSIDGFIYTILSEKEKTASVRLPREETEIREEMSIMPRVEIGNTTYTVTTIDYIAPVVKTLNVPPSVTSIEGEAFMDNTIIEIINIRANRLKKIGYGAFGYCSNLKTFDFSKLPDDISYIGGQVFIQSGLEEVEWPDDLSEIPKCMFTGSPIKKINLPPTVKRIGKCAFSFTQLDSVSIPANVTIEEEAFSNNFYMKKFTLGEGCELKDGAFADNCEMEKIVLPERTKIYGSPFYHVLNLREVHIAGSVFFDQNSYLTKRLKTFPSRRFPVFHDKYYEHYFPECFHYSPLYFGSMDPEYKQNLSTIIYNTDEPALLINNHFMRTSDYDSATLYVKPEGVETARNFEPWCLFSAIKPIEIVTGIDEIETDSCSGSEYAPGVYGYYTLSGVYMGESFESLGRSVYISRTADGIRKIVR